MKNTAYIIAFAILLAGSCQRQVLPGEDVPVNSQYSKTLTVGVDEEADTRVGFDDNNSFYWHKGDKIGVITSGGFREMTLNDQYHKKPSGVFTGNFAEEIGAYVVYPYGGHTIINDLLTYILPLSYTYESIVDDANSFNPPMFGLITGNRGTLKHLGSFFKITVSNIPAGEIGRAHV